MSERISRRSFMKRLAGASVLVATSELPLLAEDDPGKFPGRGRWERLPLAYITVSIGLEQPFSILHISDTHLTDVYPGENSRKQEIHAARIQTFGGRQEEALRDSLSWARQHVEYVLHTGDLIDFQSEANYDLVRKYFGKSMLGCLGNHEFSPEMWLSEVKEAGNEAFKDLSRKTLAEVYGYDIVFSSQIIHGVNFICMDDVYGYVTEYQVERFRKEAARNLPIVLCMHVPFHTDNTWRATRRFWKGTSPMVSAEVPEIADAYLIQRTDRTTRDFIEYLKGEKLLKAILSGHEHITMQDRFSDTANLYVVGPNFLFHGQEVMFV